MTKPKDKTIDVQFKVWVEVGVRMPAENLASALEKAGAVKYTDLVKLTSKVEDLNDYGIEVIGAFAY